MGEPIRQRAKGNPIHQTSPKSKGGSPFRKCKKYDPIHHSAKVVPIHPNSPKCNGGPYSSKGKGGTPFAKIYQSLKGGPDAPKLTKVQKEGDPVRQKFT